MKISLAELVLKNWKIEEINKDKIKVYYINKGRGNSPKPIIFPRVIKVDENFMEGIGLFLGDGDMNRKDKSHLTYSTKDKDIAKHVLIFLKNRFQLTIDNLTFSVRYNKPNNNLEKEWSEYLEIPKEKIKARFSNRHREESLDLQVNSIIFRELFECIFEKVLSKNYIKNKKLRRGLIRGLFAAEGNISIVRTQGKNYINQIVFSLHLNETNIVKIITDILEFEKITHRVNDRICKTTKEVHISNWKNYKKFWEMDLFDLCERKNVEFIKILNNLQVTFINGLIQEKISKIRIGNLTYLENSEENKTFIDYLYNLKAAKT